MPRSTITPAAAAKAAAVTCTVFLFGCTSDSADNQTGDLPRLVLQITVDQLRGDLPLRYYDRFGEGGFRYLLDQGTVYLNARHGHANTETVVGHTTLATGADPSAHGMVANQWLDRATGQRTYPVEDARYPLLVQGAGVAENEIDPTMRAARTDGRSPAAILVSTFSDELTLFYNGRPKIFGVSVKDRSAITMAGHAGKAFWFSKQSGEFVTSSFYYPSLPDWVAEWNASGLPEAYAGTSWELQAPPDTYRFGEDDRPWELDLGGFGRTFPHPFGSSDSPYFTTLLTVSPAGDELTLDFVEALFENEELGTDAVPDYLSISFSANDYVGHFFGPSSLESEDNLLRLDRTLAELFALVDDRVGLENTVIVLSADHGGAEAPGHLAKFGFEAEYVDPKLWDRSGAISELKARFGLGEELIADYAHPYLYLNQDVIQANGLDRAEVEGAVAEALTRFDGVALAVSSTALGTGDLPDTPMVRSILRNYSPSRSGDIYVVFEPHRFINDLEGTVVAASHGSPWRYDQHVPVIFAGSGIGAHRVYRPVETIDVAPTLSALFGAKPPSGSVGAPLLEVLERPGG